MSDAGRMPRRLAGSYREDDLRRCADRRRRQATTDAVTQPPAGSTQRSRPAMRAILAAIGRLSPRVA
jgi:hypothetical protein